MSRTPKEALKTALINLLYGLFILVLILLLFGTSSGAMA